ncbi:MAG: hypothetical protein H6739_33135 [Alphaproteobacteria bacterium]|nr:hypothetical protein [Alphaproteobacteria bacterium]
MIWLIALSCAADPDTMHLRLDPDGASTPTGRLVGWNLGRGSLYALPDDPLHPAWRTEARTRALAEMGALSGPGDARPILRFSGLQIDGVMGADGYHWETWAAPDRAPDPSDNLSAAQLMALMAEADAEPRITVNFGSGTAAEAADYVVHLTGTDPSDPRVAARQAWGAAAPLEVSTFEVGNEVYGWWNTGNSASGDFSYANPAAANGGDPAWHGRPASDPGDFAARALAYVEAVAAVHPDARLRLPLSQADFAGWGDTATALDALAPALAHPAVDAVVVHHYQIDDALALGVEDRDAPALVMAGTALFAPRYAALRDALDALPEPPGVAVTEYGVAGFFSRGQFDLGDTAAVGLGCADLMIAYAQWGIEEALLHMALAPDDVDAGEVLLEAWYPPHKVVDGQLVEMPSFTVTRLFADHLLARTLPVEALDVPEAEGEGYTYPLLHAAGFTDGAGAATLVVLHRGLDAPATLALALPRGWAVDGAVLWAPSDWDAPENPPIQDLDWRAARWGAELTLPPHSVAALSLVSR